MNKVFLTLIALSLSGCITPERVKTDYNIATAHDKRAQEARERASFTEAEHYERQADKLRNHDRSEVILGALFSTVLKESRKESEDGVWK
jgi:hypothetical protein